MNIEESVVLWKFQSEDGVARLTRGTPVKDAVSKWNWVVTGVAGPLSESGTTDITFEGTEDFAMQATRELLKSTIRLRQMLKIESDRHNALVQEIEGQMNE